MRVLRLIKQFAFFLLVLPFALVLVPIGFFVAHKNEDEIIADDVAAAVVAPEELEDASLELSEADKQRQWLEDLGPTARGQRIRQGAVGFRFRPVIPFILRQRR